MAQIVAPFARLNDYLNKASDAGCTVQTGFMDGPDGMREFAVITAPSKRYVVIHDVEPEESLPLAAYEYYNRRLGLNLKVQPSLVPF